MAAADYCSSRWRFAAACGVLSRCVRAEAAGKMAATAHPAAPTMLLMPGADVVPDVRHESEEPAPEVRPAARGQGQAQLTIMYRGRVLVFDDFPADKADELVRVASVQAVSSGGFADMPMARNASLQRFMEKRRHRIGARAPYAGRPSASKKGMVDQETECLLGLGISGG